MGACRVQVAQGGAAAVAQLAEELAVVAEAGEARGERHEAAQLLEVLHLQVLQARLELELPIKVPAYIRTIAIAIISTTTTTTATIIHRHHHHHEKKKK